MKTYISSVSFIFLSFISFSALSQPTLVWSKLFPGNMTGDFFFYSSDITLDTANNIYFSADSNATSGSFIGKVDKNGNVIWEENLMAGIDTFGIMTVTDAVGNTYGISSSANGSKFFKLSPSANIIWFTGFIPGVHFSNIILDHTGNFYAVVNDQINGSVYKFDTSGNEIWIKPTPVPNLWHAAVDNVNNLLVTGYYDTFHLLKIDPLGNVLWDQIFSNAPEFNPYQVLTDNQNNVLVAGSSQTNDNWDFYLLKYSSNGNLDWYSTTDSSIYDVSLALATDQNGKIYSMVHYYDGNAYGKIFIRKFDTAGNIEWSFSPEENIEFNDAGFWIANGSILTDAPGNVYAGTSSQDTTDEFTIYKLSQSGNLIWKVKENAQQPSRLKDMKMDAEGNIYAIGRAGYGPSNIWLIKLSQNISGVENPDGNFNSGISIFPNPTDQFCRINFPEAGNYGISVFDQFGTIVYTTTSTSSNSLLLNSSKWANGIYLLYCFDKGRNKIFNAKIVKAN